MSSTASVMEVPIEIKIGKFQEFAVMQLSISLKANERFDTAQITVKPADAFATYFMDEKRIDTDMPTILRLLANAIEAQRGKC